MENYPGNSKMTSNREDPRKSASERAPKEVRRVVEGEATRRKTPLGKRFRETFFGGEDAVSVWHFVMMDVLVPAAKDMIADAITQGVERTIFPDRAPGRRSSRSRSGGGSYTAYNRSYGGGSMMSSNRRDPRERDREERPMASRGHRRSNDIGEIIVEKRVQAEEVIDQLYAIIEQYEEASVHDLYEMVGLDSNPIDQRWGWRSLGGARAVRTRNGEYLIDLPKPEPLDDVR